MNTEVFASEKPRSIMRYEGKMCQIGYRRDFLDADHLQAQIDQTRRDGFKCDDLRSYYAEDYVGNPLWRQENYDTNSEVESFLQVWNNVDSYEKALRNAKDEVKVAIHEAFDSTSADKLSRISEELRLMIVGHQKTNNERGTYAAD